MAYLFGTLADKMGNVLPNTKVIARLYTDPAGDTAESTTDYNGNYEISVTNTATRYNLYTNSEEGGVNGPNFCGTRVSSGNSTTSYTLYSDSGWLVEHYGATYAGRHKDIQADSLYLRTGGYFKTYDSQIEFRIDGDTKKVWIYDDQDGSIYWFCSRPIVGAANYDFGIKKKYDLTDTYFYLGDSTLYYFKTDGSFVIGAGTIEGAVTVNAQITTNKRIVFNPSYFPQLSAYAVPVADADFAPKKYVDDQIVSAELTGIRAQRAPVNAINLIDDTTQAGSAPAGVAGDAWIADTWGVGYTDGHLYEYDGADWIDLGEMVDGTRALITSGTAAGSFAGYENYIAEYNGATWDFEQPEDGEAVLVNNADGYYYNNGYVWNSSDNLWNQYTGPQNITANLGLELAANVLDVKVDSVTTEIDGSNQIKVLGLRRVRQSGAPTPAAGEMIFWSDSDDDKVYFMYNDADAGVVKLELE